LEPEQYIALLLEVFFLIVYGLFSGAQSDFFSFKDEDITGIARAGDRRSRLLRDLLLSPRHTSLSLLIVQRLSLIGCIFAGWWLWLAFAGELNLIVALLILPSITIFVGAILSRITFQQNPLYYAYHLATPLWLLQRGIYPLRVALQKATEGLLSMLAIPSPRPEDMLEQEYLGLVEVGHQEGELESDEHRLISRVFEFVDQPVAKVMTPRLEMFTLSLDTDLQDVIQQTREHGYSRIPVYRSGKDDVAGVLYARDLLRLRLPDGHTKPHSLQELLREPFFAPIHMGVDKLFREFQRRNLHMAICVDEYGGVAGLVTMEDLLEELFGEIYDEYDLETRKWEHTGDGEYFVSGRMELDDLQELLTVDIHEPECQTVAGLVMKRLGRLPQRGETIELGKLRLVVEQVTGTKIQTLRIGKIQETGS
jgi:CBS domain containing-hemolysin-like protein